MMWSSLFITPKTITDYGKLLCITVGASMALVHSDLSFPWFNFWTWIKFFLEKMEHAGLPEVIEFQEFSSTMPWTFQVVENIFFSFGHWRRIFARGLELFSYLKHEGPGSIKEACNLFRVINGMPCHLLQ